MADLHQTLAATLAGADGGERVSPSMSSAIRSRLGIQERGTLAAKLAMLVGYFRVRTFSIENATAVIRGELGPMTTALTITGLQDRGKVLHVPVDLERGGWFSITTRLREPRLEHLM